MLRAVDTEALERATLQAVPPELLIELPGWLLPLDRGTVGRAHSAVPLSHGAVQATQIEDIVEQYGTHGHPAVFRLPELPGFEVAHRRLQTLGFARQQPTLTMCGSVEAMLAVAIANQNACTLHERPDPAWTAMYLGAGLDPVDGASRAQILARAQGCAYGQVLHAGQVVACGMASFGHGWLGVHGMRTALASRGQGLASRLLWTMALAARDKGISRVFLQVDQTSAGAHRLYEYFGLQAAWTYAYWRRPGS